MLKIVADDKIPFLRGILEPFAEVRYLPGGKISRADLMDADALPLFTVTVPPDMMRCSLFAPEAVIAPEEMVMTAPPPETVTPLEFAVMCVEPMTVSNADPDMIAPKSPGFAETSSHS